MMPQRDVWSLSLGRWGNVHLRLHIFFVLFGIFTGYPAWQEQDGGESMTLAIVCVVLLLLSVLVHELGHFFATQRLGGHMEVIVLGPVGGLRPLRVPGDPQSELLATLAGPAATLGLGFISLICALLLHPSAIGDLWNPFFGEQAAQGTEWMAQICRLSFWINSWLFLLNLIPAFPFDGGRALAALLRVVRPQVSAERATGIVATFARMVAIGLFVMAFILRNEFPHSFFPTWLALVLLSVFVFFSARVEEYQLDIDEDDDELFGYDFSQGYTSLEKGNGPRKSQPGPITRWFAERKKKQEASRIEREADEDRQADEILARLHEVGMDGLAPRERILLKRVSQRLRTREKK